MFRKFVILSGTSLDQERRRLVSSTSVNCLARSRARITGSQLEFGVIQWRLIRAEHI